MIDRDYIIDYIKKYVIDKDYVYAMWLEGADGLREVDEYSDLNFWFDVEDDKRDNFIDDLVNHLSLISKIDSRVNSVTPDIYQSNIHLENTSEYLTIDLAAQNDSRDRKDTCFISGSITEVPKIIFDRKNIITFKDQDDINIDELYEVFKEKKNRILQYSRVTKYIKREQYLECFMEYEKQILRPITMICRILYTPYIYDYELCHITRHIPEDEVKDLEKLYKISSFGDIEKNIDFVLDKLQEYEEKLMNGIFKNMICYR